MWRRQLLCSSSLWGWGARFAEICIAMEKVMTANAARIGSETVFAIYASSAVLGLSFRGRTELNLTRGMIIFLSSRSDKLK